MPEATIELDEHSEDADAALAELWAQYVADRAPELRDRLILHYAPLVKYVAGRVGSGLPAHVEQADLVSYGTFGLIDAITRYEPSREVKFESYAMARIRGAIIDELMTDEEGGSAPRLVDTLQDANALDPQAMAEHGEARQLLARAVEQLPDREKVVVSLYYFEGLTLADIGRVLGVTESRICQLHTKAVLHLRTKLVDMV